MAKAGRPPGTPKTGGRAKGTKNKTTTELREFIQEMLDDNREQIALDFALLPGAKKLEMFEKLCGYLIPKQSATNTKLDITTMSDAEVATIIKNL